MTTNLEVTGFIPPGYKTNVNNFIMGAFPFVIYGFNLSIFWEYLEIYKYFCSLGTIAQSLPKIPEIRSVCEIF